MLQPRYGSRVLHKLPPLEALLHVAEADGHHRADYLQHNVECGGRAVAAIVEKEPTGDEEKDCGNVDREHKASARPLQQ